MQYGLSADAFLEGQGYTVAESGKLADAVGTAIESAGANRENKADAMDCIQSLFDNLATSGKRIEVGDITQTLLDFFSNPDNELEEFGLLTDLAMEARANRLHQMAKERGKANLERRKALEQESESLSRQNLSETVRNRQAIER